MAQVDIAVDIDRRTLAAAHSTLSQNPFDGQNYRSYRQETLTALESVVVTLKTTTTPAATTNVPNPNPTTHTQQFTLADLATLSKGALPTGENCN